MDCLGNRAKVLDFVRRADAMAERLAVHGIELYYHNHHLEFIRYDGELLLDIIKNSTQHMGFEIDVHWVHRGGENPVELLGRYSGRVKLLHLKDYRIAEMTMPEGPFDPAKFFAAFLATVQFAEVGEGNLPMKAIIDAGLAAGSEYFLVEQDELYGRDPYDCLKTSRDNLFKLGYQEWF